MGKIRKKKINKLQNISADNLPDDENVNIDSKETTIQTILDQLQSANIEEKYCGLQTFALFIESPDNVELILNRGLVKVVAPLMFDAAGSVRNAAAGVLRNLSAIKLEICDSMMDQDVMTPLTCFFHEHAETWTPTTNLKTRDEDSETFIHCINLLMNLCESSELAIKYVGSSRILDILPRYLDLTTFGNEIAIAVMQCLFVVVEDNPTAVEKLKATAERHLQELLSHDSTDPSMLLIRTLAAGVIIIMCGGNIALLPISVTNQIMSILAQTLSIDHRLACNQLSSNVPLRDSADKAPTIKGKEAQILENQLKSVSHMLDAQQTAIEIIANVCSCEDNDNSVGGSDSSDSEDMGNEEDNCTGGETLLAEDRLPTQVLEGLASLEIFLKVWARTQLPAENVMLILKEYEGSELIYKKITSLQTKALLCINNMLSALPLESVGGVNGVYKIWVDTGKLIFKKETNLNLVEAATAVMRAALDKIKFTTNGSVNECNLFSDLALSDIESSYLKWLAAIFFTSHCWAQFSFHYWGGPELTAPHCSNARWWRCGLVVNPLSDVFKLYKASDKMMITGIKECQVPEIRSNLIRMIGILALLLVNNLNDTSSNVICAITEFILEQAHKENEVWVLAEAVDTLVDLYSEDETDILAAKVKLVEKLAILAPILKNKARQQKKLPKEYKVLVTTANSNLPRFIKYKKERIKNLQA